MDAFFPNMTVQEINQLSMLSLAHVGDAVYELLTRSTLCTRGCTQVAKLHRESVARVNAPAQARAAERILPLLTPAELAVYKRGRNAHVNSIPSSAEVGEYHAATGLEALFGWLYLQGERERIVALFAAITEED